MKKRVRLEDPAPARRPRVRLEEPAPATEPPPPPQRKRVRLDSGPMPVMTTYRSGDHRQMFPAFPGDKPRECKLCEQIYWRPCDGNNPECANGIFYLSNQSKGKRKR